MNNFIERIFKTGIALQGEIPRYMTKNYFAKGLGWHEFKKDIKELQSKRHPGEDYTTYIDALAESFRMDLQDSINGNYEKERKKINVVASQIHDFEVINDVIQVDFNDNILEIRKSDLYDLEINREVLAEIIHKCYEK